jgi:hypothetical protein
MSLRCLDRKQNKHHERGKDDERIHYEFQPVWHDVAFPDIRPQCPVVACQVQGRDVGTVNGETRPRPSGRGRESQSHTMPTRGI